MKKLITTIWLNTVFTLFAYGQCVKMSSVINSTVFCGIDNIIKLEYDTVQYRLLSINSSSSKFRYIQLSNTDFIFQTCAIGEIEVSLLLENRSSGIKSTLCNLLSVRELPPPLVAIDSFYSGDTIKKSQIKNLEKFRVEFIVNGTFHRQVHSFKAVLMGKDSALPLFSMQNGKNFSDLKSRLNNEVKSDCILILYDIVVRVEGVRIKINPIQFYLME